MNNDFIKSPDEILLWQEKPAFKPFMMMKVAELFDSVKFLVFLFVVIIAYSKLNNDEFNLKAVSIIAFLILGISLFQLGKRYFDYKATTYYLTNWRIIIENKNAAVTVKSLDKSWIKSLDITKSKTEEKFDAGTILIDVGEVNNELGEEEVIYRLEAIPEPENVLRMF